MSAEALPTEFPLVEQGYDPGRVDEYLATQMLQLRTELDKARTYIAELEGELALAKEAEEALKLTMVVAKRASDEMIATAQAEAKEIVGEARREAFALMTEAHTDADGSIGEGREIIAAAREEALQIVNDVEAETARLIAERNAALAKLHTDYETESAALIDRINTLRSIAADLEAKTTAPAPATPAPQQAAAVTYSTPQDQPSPATEGRAAVESQTGDASTNDQDGDAPNAARIRESFSGRRSAKLPRIGEEAGRSALAAATAMRAHMTHEPDDSDKDGDDDLAARTA